MVDIDRSTLDTWINKDKLSYIEIGRRLECSMAYIKKYAIKLGISLPIRNTNKTPSWNKGKHKYSCIKCQKGHESVEKYKDYLNSTLA